MIRTKPRVAVQSATLTKLQAAQLAAVHGGAYEFYVNVKGTKSGQTKGETP